MESASFQGLGQEMRQTQNLSARQMQYLRLLQMNLQELNSYLNEAQLENPLLELASPEISVASDEPTAIKLADWAAFSGTRAESAPSDPNDADDTPTFEEMQAAHDGRYSLEEYLKAQIDVSVDGVEYRMVDYLIGFLDENGYLTVTAEQLAREFSCDVSLARETIGYLQTLDPPGVGAANLGECLQIQLFRMGICHHGAMRLCGECLEDLAHGRFQKAARTVGMSVEDVTALYAVIRALNPRPASAFGEETTAVLIPDVTVTEREGRLVCTYNRQYLSSLTVNRDYLSLGRDDEDTRVYLNRKMSQALWIVHALQSRQETIERIVGVILEEQAPFFSAQAGELRPLRLKDVAARIGVHESTVSRAISEKYLQCRRGVFPIRSFFAAAVHGDRTADPSSSSVKDRLRALIAAEDPHKPLSDAALCNALAADGVSLARRTVAKYREEMGIPSSATRGKGSP
jgi:RNA polymerase sigma-54 factor